MKAAQRDGDETMVALSAARGRVIESRELLEQYRLDISALAEYIDTLQAGYEKRRAGERLAVAKEHHTTLEREYRDSIWHTINAVQTALRAQLEKRGQVDARRQEITELSYCSGIKRNTFPSSSPVST